MERKIQDKRVTYMIIMVFFFLMLTVNGVCQSEEQLLEQSCKSMNMANDSNRIPTGSLIRDPYLDYIAHGRIINHYTKGYECSSDRWSHLLLFSKGKYVYFDGWAHTGNWQSRDGLIWLSPSEQGNPYEQKIPFRVFENAEDFCNWNSKPFSSYRRNFSVSRKTRRQITGIHVRRPSHRRPNKRSTMFNFKGGITPGDFYDILLGVITENGDTLYYGTSESYPMRVQEKVKSFFIQRGNDRWSVYEVQDSSSRYFFIDVDINAYFFSTPLPLACFKRLATCNAAVDSLFNGLSSYKSKLFRSRKELVFSRGSKNADGVFREEMLLDSSGVFRYRKVDNNQITWEGEGNWQYRNDSLVFDSNPLIKSLYYSSYPTPECTRGKSDSIPGHRVAVFDRNLNQEGLTLGVITGDRDTVYYPVIPKEFIYIPVQSLAFFVMLNGKKSQVVKTESKNMTYLLVFDDRRLFCNETWYYHDGRLRPKDENGKEQEYELEEVQKGEE